MQRSGAAANPLTALCVCNTPKTPHFGTAAESCEHYGSPGAVRAEQAMQTRSRLSEVDVVLRPRWAGVSHAIHLTNSTTNATPLPRIAA